MAEFNVRVLYLNVCSQRTNEQDFWENCFFQKILYFQAKVSIFGVESSYTIIDESNISFKLDIFKDNWRFHRYLLFKWNFVRAAYIIIFIKIQYALRQFDIFIGKFCSYGSWYPHENFIFSQKFDVFREDLFCFREEFDIFIEDSIF